MIECSRCGSDVVRDVEGQLWRTAATGRANCRRGGPHKVIVDAEVDWDKFDSVLDSWNNDAL